MMKIKLIKIALSIFSAILLFANSLSAQIDSIFDQGVYRTFITRLPADYSTANEYPLVLNLHGRTSSASEQQFLTQFDGVADSEGFVVFYPDGIDNTWTTIGNSDSDFLSNLVDTIRANYSINNCLFVTGFSQGGFMTYKFANTTSHNVTAIAVGSGNSVRKPCRWRTYSVAVLGARPASRQSSSNSSSSDFQCGVMCLVIA